MAASLHTSVRLRRGSLVDTVPCVGLLDRLSRKASPSAPGPELSIDVLREAQACFDSGRDEGRCTRGRGSAVLMSVAGVVHGQAMVERIVAHGGGVAEVSGRNLPAVVLRDPKNEHDSNAVRVLVDGLHIGFVPAHDAGRYQALLIECESRGVLLVGSVRLMGGDGRPWGAGLQLRPRLEAWTPPTYETSGEPGRSTPVSAASPDRDDLARIVESLQRISQQQPVRSKQKAGLVVAQVRTMLPTLERHATALGELDEERGQSLSDALFDLEGCVDELSDAADADEREDAHADVTTSAEGVLEHLR